MANTENAELQQPAQVRWSAAPTTLKTDSMETTTSDTAAPSVDVPRLVRLLDEMRAEQAKYKGWVSECEEAGGSLTWAARYGDIVDAFEFCISRVSSFTEPNA